MAPLAGLTGLYGPADNVPHGTTGRDASNWGTPADKRHSTPGDSSKELSYAGTAYGQDDDLLGGREWESAPPASDVILDSTPDVHSAPYPNGIEHDLVEAAAQMRILHGLDLGGPEQRNRTGTPYPFTVDAGFHDSPNESALSTSVPGQLRSGSKDVSQGYGQANSGTFGLGHQFRRWFKDNIPLDRTGVMPDERPFYGKHPVWQARFDGEDSPYAQSGDTSINMGMSDSQYGDATPYEQPPDPTVQPATGYVAEAPIDDYGWVQI